MMPRAVLFDLDDTLYDHLHSARSALIAMQQRNPEMLHASVRDLEDCYSNALESIHHRLLRGEVSQTEARTIRMRQFFGDFGMDRNDSQAHAEYTQFRRDYDEACQVVRGTHELLTRLKGQVRLGVITNNLVSEQIPKLRQLALDDYFDAVTISEEVGVAKPDPRIFEVAVARLQLGFEEVVVVGDSLSSDIAGAVGVGMRCVWLKRRPDSTEQSPQDVRDIEQDFSDLESCLTTILQWDTPSTSA